MARTTRLVKSHCSQQALPAVVALGSLFLNIILVDDMLDEDPRGQHHRLDVGPVANMASALQAIGYEAITRSNLPLETQAIIFHQLNQMMLKTTLGQYWDSKNPCDEDSSWRVTRTKSSPYFGTSFFVGALMSGCPEAVARHLAEMGQFMGR